MRTDIINHIISTKLSYRAKYLEIGLRYPEENYFAINCAYKECVDPYTVEDGYDYKQDEEKIQHIIKHVLTYQMTSDEFFEQNKQKYDIIFIDGLHEAEQVLKDIKNSYNCLNPGGYIVIHDCLPVTKENQEVPRHTQDWNGTTWKAIPNLYKAGIEFVVVDDDQGCGVIKYTGEKNFDNYTVSDLNYEEVFNNYNVRNTIMHVVSVQEFTNICNYEQV